MYVLETIELILNASVLGELCLIVWRKVISF